MNTTTTEKELFTHKLNKGEIIDYKELVASNNLENIEKNILDNWYKNIVSFDFLNLDIKSLQEVIIHGPTYLLYKQQLEDHLDETDMTAEDLQLAYETLTLKNGVEWNYTHPFVSFDCYIKNCKVRVTLIHYSISASKLAKAYIRVMNNSPLSFDRFHMSADNILQIERMIKQQENILIAGPTASGKTSFLNSMLSLTDPTKHIIILEDLAEIYAPHKNVSHLVATDDNNRSLKDYMKYCMRMAPDRIIIGELRSDEVESYLLAMNTGHQGLMSTIHANSAKDAIERLALLFKIYSAKDLSYELVLKLVCQNINKVIFMENQRVKEIIKVFGSENESIFYEQLTL